MIRFDHVGFGYQGAQRPTLVDVDLTVEEGEFALLVGPTGSGKSTLLAAVNGLVPRFTGGTLTGRVTVDGLDTAAVPPREFAATVGMVRQDPLLGFVTDTVEEELAYGMEQLGYAPALMRTRVEDTLDVLGIADLRARPLRTLSGGQQQRVAIGAVLAAGARVLVLDEPTSALDPTSAEEVLAALLRLVHDVGITLLIAEHRLERVAEYADRVVTIDPTGVVAAGEPASMLGTSMLAPPIVQLARLAGWDPPPLSVRDARRQARGLRARLGSPPPPAPVTAGARDGLSVRAMSVSYGPLVAVRDASLDVSRGQIAVLMGRNGSGKSSLLWALTGVGPRRSGRCTVDDVEVTRLPTAQVLRHIRLVPQSASDLLFLDSVDAECAAADTQTGRPPGTCRALLDRIVSGLPGDRHPRDLSEGQRLGLVLAVQLTADPTVLLLDEPTRGLDYTAKQGLLEILRAGAADGRTVVIATHDVEFAAEIADRVLVMATGEVIADGPPAEVLGNSRSLAPQVARVFAPEHWLTVEQVRRALTDGPDVPAAADRDDPAVAR